MPVNTSNTKPDNPASGDTDLLTLHHMLAIQAERIETLMGDVKRLKDIIDGDATRDLPGLRARVASAEGTVADFQRYKLLIKGISIGMGLTMVTSISTLVTLVSQVLGAKP